MARKEVIHGYWVTYEDSALEGATYLRSELGQAEVKTIFDAAHLDGQAEFQDNYRHKWTVVSNRDGTYTLMSRQY